MPILARSSALVATAVAAMLAATATPGLAQTVYSGTGAAATAASASFAGAIGLSTLETFDARTDGELAPAWTYAGTETATLSNGFGVTSAYPYGGGGVTFFGVDFGANTITGVTFTVGFDEAFLIDDVRVATGGAAGALRPSRCRGMVPP